MLTMIGKRLMFAIPSLVGVVIDTFLLTRALPGDPAAYFAGPAANKEAVEQIRKKLGLDKPLIEQFFRYTADLAHGDFGNSLTTGQPVASEIRNRLPASAELTLLGLVVSIVIAIPLGILAATKPGSWIDHLCRVTTTAGVFVAQHAAPAGGWWTFDGDSFGKPNGTYLDPTQFGTVFHASGTYGYGADISASAVAPAALIAASPATASVESDYLHESCFAAWSDTPGGGG